MHEGGFLVIYTQLFLFTEMGNTRMFNCVFHMLIYMYISGDHPKRSECEQYKVQKVLLFFHFCCVMKHTDQKQLRARKG